MKKVIFLGMLASLALGACNNDDLTSGSGAESQKVFDGDVAYMTVRINDVGSLTRASAGDYAYGTTEEHTVTNAYFYFYDASGVFVSEAEVWDGGTDGSTPNVEFEGSTVIVLKGLTGTGYPNYVVTVLNRPAGFTPGETLDVMAAQLANAAAEGIQDNNGNFVMSTSSYIANANGATDSRRAYFATPVTEDDFFSEPIDMDEVNPVDIYVERLAAKVETGISQNLTNETITLSDGSILYKLTETIAGNDNEEDVTGEGDDTVGNGEGTQDVYIKITGWALNGTAKYSNIVKNIDAAWTESDLGFAWNVPTDYRSYWGKSFNYGLGWGSYPTSSEGAGTQDSDQDGTMLSDYLNYVSYNNLKNTFTTTTGTTTISGTPEYCAENTNTAGDASGVLQSKNSSAITNVLIAAEVCNEDGEGLDLVRYQGVLFTKTAYLQYVMSELTALGELNVYTALIDETTGETTYTHIDGSYIELVNAYDGYVTVGLVEDAFTDGTYYEKGTDNNGETVYTEISDPTEGAKTALADFNSNHPNVNAYTGGQMYYNIPIEHLNNNEGTETDESGNVIPIEANYGIVRNHWYQLTVTDIANLGKGVFDPDEVIIPNIEDEQYYYIGAQINILSWMLVSQEVTL